MNSKQFYIAAFAVLVALPAAATVSDVSNQADVNHPDIHQNVGGGADGPLGNASPEDTNDTAGNLHGIGDTPGQDGDNPNGDGGKGLANELETIHGGIGDVNPAVD